MLKPALASLALLAFSLNASAFISEEIDDHKSTICSGSSFEMNVDETSVEATGQTLQGEEFSLNGELISLTIDTEDASFYYKVLLDRPNSLNLRYLTVEVLEGEGHVAVHYDISTVAGSLGTAICTTNWN